MCETYSQHAYLHLSGCFYQGFRTGDDGGSGGAYVVDDEDMFALKLRDGGARPARHDRLLRLQKPGSRFPVFPAGSCGFGFR